MIFVCLHNLKIEFLLKRADLKCVIYSEGKNSEG